MFQNLGKTLREFDSVLSKEAMNICISGLATSTREQYSSHIQMFEKFCAGQGITNYLATNISTAIEFLTVLFKDGKSYSTINSARSALSHHLTLLDCSPGTDFGTHPLTSKFMRGVFKLRPTVSKYKCTWDVKLVLDLLRTWNNNKISMKNISLKCVMLLALSSGLRMQTLANLNLDNMLVFAKKMVFTFSTVLKASKPGNNKAVEFFKFEDDLSICPLTCIKSYLSRTESIRNTRLLFCSYIKPYKAVSSQSLSRWICQVLREAEVPFEFKAHSTRSASASKAAKHLDIHSVLQTVGWRSEATFAKHYNKVITEEEGSYSKVVLDKQLN